MSLLAMADYNLRFMQVDVRLRQTYQQLGLCSTTLAKSRRQ